IRDKSLSVVNAAVDYNIPIRTVYNKLSANDINSRPGGKTILTKDEEELLVHTIILFQEWQCPVTPSIVIHLAKSYMMELGKAISPNSTLRDWFTGFMKRWSKQLKLGKTEKLEKNRSNACRKEVIDNWFQHLHEVLTKYNLFNRPEALWNVDEAGFTDDPGRRSVVIKRNTKHTTSSQSGTGKSHTTLLICTSASGKKLPPYIIFQGAQLWSTSIPKNGFPGTRYNCTKSGWVDEPVFFHWFVNQFIPNVSKVKRPIILFFDGHQTHISARIVKAAMENQIELECFPPHTTIILQPLDVVTLHKIKTAWRSLLVEHNIKTNSSSIDKQRFTLLISELWKNHLLKEHCSSGFSKAGIYPYEPQTVSKEKLLIPPTSTVMVLPVTDAQRTSSNDIIIDKPPRQRLHRSASSLNLTTTILRDEPNNSCSNSISISSSSSIITTTSTNNDGTASIDSSPTAYNQTDCSSSYVPVLTDLTYQIPVQSS
ncbi:unnamed protein product, partial [Rotaria sordida]